MWTKVLVSGGLVKNNRARVRLSAVSICYPVCPGVQGQVTNPPGKGRLKSLVRQSARGNPDYKGSLLPFMPIVPEWGEQAGMVSAWKALAGGGAKYL